MWIQNWFLCNKLFLWNHNCLILASHWGNRCRKCLFFFKNNVNGKHIKFKSTPHTAFIYGSPVMNIHHGYNGEQRFALRSSIFVRKHIKFKRVVYVLMVSNTYIQIHIVGSGHRANVSHLNKRKIAANAIWLSNISTAFVCKHVRFKYVISGGHGFGYVRC